MLSQTSEYRAWYFARKRCHDEADDKFHRYGGRGVFMCRRWRESFTAFLQDMGEQPKGTLLGRLDKSRGYEPGNCRWMTKSASMRLSATSIALTIDGAAVPLPDAAEGAGLLPRRVQWRLKHGWPLGEALSLPVGKGTRHSATAAKGSGRFTGAIDK
ncbi:hypothetical protein [Rhizobium sp. BG4]|uniref:hypothetical protein n=1 Tax=Rhizobium sp. BG4 TaxID=2613770 RepID=UPI00193DDAC8|nr:hypothetical protein [Rhizobium sp. BG4]QRM45359.1 hypothetical protein F2982_19075 [Rhizobium sp. BG4]